MKVSVFIATSLDGFIAGPDEELDWLGDTPEEGSGRYSGISCCGTLDNTTEVQLYTDRVEGGYGFAELYPKTE